MNQSVKSGLCVLESRTPPPKGLRAALLVNKTSVNSSFKYSWDILSSYYDIVRIFSPEHGVFSTEQDQVPVIKQPEMPCETVSLYGNHESSLVPDKQFLSDIDCIVYDIQDVGSRYYTYLNTMILLLKEISGTSCRMVILDRPNPLNGIDAEGPGLDLNYESFCGVVPVSPRHGLTAGEMALYVADYFKLDVEIEIVPIDGWSREQTALPPQWIFPSPNMPYFETALVYPGMCLFEGLNISEGRGTTRPFEIFGAPFINGRELCEELNGLDLPGVIFRPEAFIPTFNKYRGQIVEGAFIHVTDYSAFKPFLTGVAAVYVINKLYDELEFLKDVYEFNTKHYAFDLLTGSDEIRTMISKESSLDDIVHTWQHFEKIYLNNKEEFHLY